MLQRLDDLGAHLAARPDAIALLGLGSAGVEHHRMDEHSDLDFFVITTDPGAYVESIDWLDAVSPVAYSFLNVLNGRKVLFADGVFGEYAAFTPDELTALPFTGARVVWQRDDAPQGLAECGRPPARAPFETVEFHLNEALTNLYVGLHREIRGERLTAMRFIQVYAVDRAIALLNLSRSACYLQDPFDGSRRVEQAYPPSELPLAALVPGYSENVAAATAMLEWLTERFPCDPMIVAAIRSLLPG
jgi:hypothetical protein